MKRLVLLLALALVACAAPPAPTEEPTEEIIEPTQTPVIVVETVIVTVIPTDMPTDVPTQAPTSTPLPSPTEVPATLPPATESPAATAVSAPAETESGLVSLDNALGGGWFSNMTLTANTLSLRCQEFDQIIFSAKATDPNIALVDFYYRIQDRATGAVFDWQGPRRMLAGANGNFTLDFSGEDVNPNFRKPNGWFDFQIVGLNNSGGRVGNSEKVVQQVTYMFDCP